MTEFIRERLLIAIPFLIAIGKIAMLKGMIKVDFPAPSGHRHSHSHNLRLSDINHDRLEILVAAIFITGVLQGAVMAFASIGFYDTVKKTGEARQAA